MEKENDINKYIILADIDKAHPKKGRQLGLVKFKYDHFKEVIHKVHKQRKKYNATKRQKNNQPVKVPINLQPCLTKYRFKLLQFAGEKFEDIWQVKFVFADMPGNLKVMLNWPPKNRHVLDFKTESDVIEILSVLESSIQLGGITTFFLPGIFLDLRVLGHFGLKIRQ